MTEVSGHVGLTTCICTIVEDRVSDECNVGGHCGDDVGTRLMLSSVGAG